MDDARTNREEHRESVFATDGAILMSSTSEGVDLDWALSAFLASQVLEAPIFPCEPDCSDIHILGPYVSFNRSDKSILWRWSPGSPVPNERLTRDIRLRIASTCGPSTKETIDQTGYEVDMEGPASAFIDQFIDDLPLNKREGIGIVLHEKHWRSNYLLLREAGFKVIPSCWNERSRDPFEEVRDRIIQINSCERVISTSMAGLGISNACGVPFAAAASASLPIFDRLDGDCDSNFLLRETMSFFGYHDIDIIELDGLHLKESTDIPMSFFKKPVQLEPQVTAELTLGICIGTMLKRENLAVDAI